MKRLQFIILLLFLIASPLSFISANTVFNNCCAIEIPVNVNGTSYNVMLYSSSTSCPDPGLGLLNVTTASGQSVYTGPVRPIGVSSSLNYGEIILVGGFTNYGEIILVGGFTAQGLTFTYTYAGCTYTGTL